MLPGFRAMARYNRWMNERVYGHCENLSDAEILEWVETLDEKRLAAPLKFRSIVGNRDRSFPLWFAVQHFFNHQTHHRGQVTTLLMQSGVDPGVTDLMWLPGMEEAA